MGDMGDFFRAVKSAGQKKRADNRQKSAEMLTKKGIPFTTKNGGAHLIVDGRADFWPGTGKWKMRKGTGGYGVRGLLKELKKNG